MAKRKMSLLSNKDLIPQNLSESVAAIFGIIMYVLGANYNSCTRIFTESLHIFEWTNKVSPFEASGKYM